jgi:D-beta-D-heptose 7-phosphate kinase/D-beta-D-heptose 1-phosphate adenosyltransferase
MKLLLLGDRATDRYKFGTVKRMSPEAPVPVISGVFKTKELPGMAANVAENLKALGCTVDTRYGNKICIKTRYIDVRSNQHLLRIDEDHASDPLALAGINYSDYDAVVISDYNKGSISYETVETIRREYDGPVFVDSKKTDLKRFEGCFVKVNSLENERAVSKPDNYYIVTRGSMGAKCGMIEVPSPQVEAHDACGAGDTFLAAFAYDYIQNKDIRKAIGYANKAASITILHTGVYAPKAEEIERHYGRLVLSNR